MLDPALRGGRRRGTDARPYSPTWREACRPTSSRRCRLPRSPGGHHRRRDRLRPRYTSRCSISWAMLACGRSNSSGRPRLLHDYRTLENAIGDALAESGFPLGRIGTRPYRDWLYRLALEQGYLDAFLTDYVVLPFVRRLRWFDSLERRWTDFLAGESRVSRTRSSLTSKPSKNTMNFLLCPGSNCRSPSLCSDPFVASVAEPDCRLPLGPVLYRHLVCLHVHGLAGHSTWARRPN